MQAHAANGGLKSGVVGTAQLVPGSVTDDTLSTAVRAKLNAISADAREIELRRSATSLEWRYVGDTSWTELVALADLTGPAGPQGVPGETGAQGDPGATGETGPAGADGHTPVVEWRSSGGFLQQRTDGGVWENVVALSAITGPAGQDGQSVRVTMVAASDWPSESDDDPLHWYLKVPGPDA